jgi:hypothetical protein
MSSTGYCVTPKQQAIAGIDDFMQPCPPPPRVSIQGVIEEVLAPALELRDAPRGFFLAAPCNNSSNTNDQRVLFSKSNPITLLPKKSSKQPKFNRIKLQPKMATITTSSNLPEDTYRQSSARSA